MPDSSLVFDEKSAAQKTVVVSIRKQIEIAQENILAGDYDSAAWCVDFAISQLPVQVKEHFKERLKEKIARRVAKEVPKTDEIAKLANLSVGEITDADLEKYPNLDASKLRIRIYRDRKIEKIALSELEKFTNKVLDEMDQAGLGALKEQENTTWRPTPTAEKKATIQAPLGALPESVPK